MKHSTERSSADWFQAAMDCYIAEHQGCPCCHVRHCVFRSLLGNRIEFYCSSCEFSVHFNAQTGAYHATPGSDQVVSFILDEAS